MTATTATIHYTHTDEAPMLATYSLLPIIRAVTAGSGVDFATPDISLAGRILAAFADHLRPEQRIPDALGNLGALTASPEANIVKLPNISASVPQLRAAISELQEHGYAVPDYPAESDDPVAAAIRQRYAAVLGSAVNPVLREGNSDRRVAEPVKRYAQANPHSMGAWQAGSKTRVAHMSDGDFYGSEQSWVAPDLDTARIELHSDSGTVHVLKEVPLQPGEVIDAARMSARALRAFLREAIAEAKRDDVLFSVHLKATMMKVSDPIMFGHAVSTVLEPVFEQHAGTLQAAGVDPDYGLADLYKRLETLEPEQRQVIEADIQACLTERPRLAMVDSDRGISNLHVPSDVIIDASMPAMIRGGGKMWGPSGEEDDTLAVIPDRCYAGVYQQTIAHCKQHGAFDPASMGSVANVGLMAKKAEEYGSHDKTVRIPAAGTVKVVNQAGETVMEHAVEAGDIWRLCQTKDIAIRDWVRLAVERSRLSGAPAVFWLDQQRAHDANLIAKVERYLTDHDTSGLDLRILPPAEACAHTLERCRAGEDTISVTGNVLRDYLTDLFPILELGTSAKMLSIVPLLAGGGLFETGAGGSAPKHVQQLQKENHLRWDSLGEFLALAVSLETAGRQHDNPRIGVLARCLDEATGRLLVEGRSPLRKVGQLDNRGSHCYLALYWLQALAAQSDDSWLRERSAPVAQELEANWEQILNELAAVQGQAVDLGGYYQPDCQRTEAVMRPSATFNRILGTLS
ncbi:MAG: NADP-dependent isocitrate dehydrogenase [Planctomycetota bacterium]